MSIGRCIFNPKFISSLKNAQVTLVGLGLMAGSLAMRLKQDTLCRRVVALLKRPEAAAEAEMQGVVDLATTDPTAALPDADLVIFATPVRVLIDQLQIYAGLLKPGAIVTDVGSTKRAITNALTCLPDHVYPVGSHPMCGKEISGLSAADPTLYQGATWVITPLERTPTGVVELIHALVTAIGAQPLVLKPAQHDQLVAAISHLPYLLSATLVLVAQTIAADDPLVWRVAASGFKDTSRLAASNVQMMLDILLTNPDAVSRMIDLAQGQLSTLQHAITTGDDVVLRQLLQQAHQQRTDLYPGGSR